MLHAFGTNTGSRTTAYNPPVLLRRIADFRDPQSWAGRLRARRFAFFQSLMATLKGPVRILDVGGAVQSWIAQSVDPRWRVTVVNIRDEAIHRPEWICHVIGDARAMPFADRSFDVVFSNSVIEHVGTSIDQQNMAREVVRVGDRYFIQTPNRHFPIEPHYHVPLFQYLPLVMRAELASRFDLGWQRKTNDLATALAEVRSIRLLTERDLTGLFPHGAIYRERVLGLTKSLVAYGGWDP